MIGAVVGVAAFFAKSAAILAYVSMTSDHRQIQDIYATGGSGGIWTAIAATFFLSVVTPIGEEFLFRGVVTTALLRLGPITGVVGGAIIFAIFHGTNMVFPAALIVGLAAGEVFRRSRSIWPGIVVHFVVNLPAIPLMLLAGLGK
jgi:membrane protease YdiL (CAAX protease family)